MNDKHPITPPPELIPQWVQSWPHGADFDLHLATQAARRPKPLTLKKQALGALEHLALGPDPTAFLADMDTIRKALEALPE